MTFAEVNWNWNVLSAWRRSFWGHTVGLIPDIASPVSFEDTVRHENHIGVLQAEGDHSAIG